MPFAFDHCEKKVDLMIALLSDNEDERHAVRGEYHRLDSGPIVAYDETAHQWFKAVTELDGTKTTSDDAFWTPTLLPTARLVVPDSFALSSLRVCNQLPKHLTLSRWRFNR